MKHVRVPLLFLLPVSILPALCALSCGGSGSVVVVVPGLPVIPEIEPNDQAFLAQELGLLLPGDHFVIAGSMCPFDCDPADGFAFSTGQPCVIEFALVAADPFADLDVCAYDPIGNVYIACFESGGPVELGSLAIAGPAAALHLVVSSFAGGGNYSLEVAVHGLAAAKADEEQRSTLVHSPRALGARTYPSAAIETGEVDTPHALVRTIELVLDEHGRLLARRELDLLSDGSVQAHVAISAEE